MDPIRILAVDDHFLLREGIGALIASQPDMRLVAEASSGAEAVTQFRAHRPDVTLLDVQMPGMGGIEALTKIRGEFPDARVIILTTYGGDALALRALQAGAFAYVLKGAVRTELLGTIRSVHQGRRRIGDDVVNTLAAHRGDETLTTREIEVLQFVAAGNSNKQVATRLLVTEDTVKSHMKRIIAKLGANDRTHAVTLALARGILPAVAEGSRGS